MDIDKYKEAMENLASHGLAVSDYDDTHINGTITAENDGLMFTSIPYDEGWTIYVDGVKTELQKIGNSFIAVPVSAGTHTIQMKYQARLLKPGLIISIISLIIIAALIFFRIKFKKEITEDGAIDLLLESTHKKRNEQKESDSESEEK